MAIKRTASGVVLVDGFDRSNSTVVGGDWIERSGDWSISSNRLAINATTSIIENDAAAIGEQFLQATVQRGNVNNTQALFARFRWLSGSFAGYALFLLNTGLALRRASSGSFANLGTDESGSISANTDYTLQLYVADGVQEGWRSGSNATVSDTDTTHNGTNGGTGTRWGAGSAGTGQWNNWVWCSSKHIAVSGLAAGQKAKVLNGSDTVVAEATESGGTATIDCSRYQEEQSAGTGATETVPFAGWAALVITDSSDNELDRYDATGVYPGDTYEPAAAPDAPTLTATPGAATVTLETGTFAGNEVGETHVSSRWQITSGADTGFAAPIIDTTSATDLESYTRGLPGGTDYLARALHTGDIGGGSPWSVTASFTTAVLPAGIARIHSGRLLRDDFERADDSSLGGDWTDHGTVTWRIESGEARAGAASSGDANASNYGPGLFRSGGFAQARVVPDAVAIPFTSDSIWLSWRWGSSAPIGYGVATNWSSAWIQEGDGSAVTNIATQGAIGGITGSGWYLQLHVAAGLQRGALYQGTGAKITVSASDTTLDGATGVVGTRQTFATLSGTARRQDLDWWESPYVLVYGLSTGQKAKILDGSDTVLLSATESSGVGTLDVLAIEEAVPASGFASLIVTDADDAELGRYDLTGVEPGDEYEYSTTPPDAPPATGDPADVVTPPTGTINTGLEGEGGVPFVGLSGSVGRFQLVTGLHVRALDLNDFVELEVSTDGDLSLDDVREGRVVRIVDPPYGIFEYRISEAFEEESATGRPTIRVRAVHPLVDLADRGLYEEPTVEGGSLVNPGEITDTVPGWVDRIIAAGARNGAAYYVAGADVAEWGTDVEYTIDVSGMTPLAVLYALRERLVNELTGEVPELVVQRTGDEGAYEIDILRAPRNSDLPRRRLSLGTTISRLAISRGAGEQGPVITVIRPLGRVPEFGSEPSSIADLVLEVTAIDGNAVTVQLPEIGVLGYPAILWDDQFGGHATLPNRYALLPDGTLEEITDTIEADQELVLDDASGLSVGDLIGIRTDTGGAVVEIVNPGAFDQYGRRVASPSYAELRGERNWVLNPWMEEWDAPYPDLIVCEVRVSQTSTTLALTGLTEGDVISAGDVILIRGGNAAFGVVVETGDTADVSGEADPVMEQAFTVTAGEYAYIFRQAGRFPADGWRGVTAIPGWLGGILIRRAQNDEDLGLAYDGEITSQDWQQAESGLVEVTALPTSRNAIGFGDQFRFGSVRAWVAGVASDSGSTASVYLLGGTGTGSGAVRIDQPPLHLLGVPGETVVATPEMPAVNPQTNRPGIETGLFTVRAYPGRDRGWAVVRFLIWPIRSFPDDAYAGDRRARIRVVDGTGTVLATAVDVVRTLVDGAAVAVSLGVEVELDADTPQDLRVQFLPGAFAPGLTEHQSIIYYLSQAQFTLGPDPDVPATKYSWANQMYTRALNELDARSVPQQTVEVTYNDLSYQPAFGPDNYSLDVGQSVRLVGRRNQATARVYRREVPLEDPTRTNLVVGPDLVRLTRRV